MKTQVFSLYDLKACAFMAPFQQATRGMAIRAVEDLLSDQNHAITRHASDYQLFKLADFDDETGLFTPLVPPELVITLSELSQWGSK